MSALDEMGLGTESVTDLINQIKDEAPAVADLMTTLNDMAKALSDSSMLDVAYAESVELRRSHLCILVALYDNALERLGEAFGAVEVASRLGLDGDDQVFGLWEETIKSASGILADLVNDLGQRHERDR